MFCPNCGSSIREGSSFCANCGTPVRRSPPAAPPGQPAGVQPPQPQPQTYQQPTYAPQAYQQPPANVQRPVYPQPQQPPYGYYQQPAARPKRKKTAAVLITILVLVVAIPLAIIGTMAIRDILNGGGNPTFPTSDATTAESIIVPTETSSGGGDELRDNFTSILGGGTDTCTLMIYMCGADLESGGGYASADLAEILAASLSSQINIVIQTGGCYDWQPTDIEDGSVQRWLVQNGQLVLLENLGMTTMLTASDLSSFINFATSNFPANRNSLVFWDHGGGSLYGFGSDEIYGDTCLYLSDIAEALASSGVKFDFVGFDACLMGTVETAYMLEPYADYLIASEETEPAYGWNYTPWLNAWSQNTSLDTVALGTQIVDSFIAQNTPDSTLSVVELRQVPAVYDALCDFMANADTEIANDQFTLISTAVANTKSFADDTYDLIDIIDFTNQTDISGEQELVAAVENAVKYRNNCTVAGCYGLSLYFPYADLSVYGYSKQIFDSFGFGGDIYVFYDEFVNILANGQEMSDSRTLQENMTGEDIGGADYSGYDWYDAGASGEYDYETIDYTELEIFWDETNQYYYLPLTAEDWDLITAVEMQVLLDDGGGYIDLGSDQYFETDDAGNLILNYGADNTWVAIGGQIVCYYAEEIITTEEMNIYIGYVPAVLNDSTEIEIMLEWDGDSQGFIAGYRLAGSNSTIGGEGTIGKGYLPFYVGDVVRFTCDYYTYDKEFDANYYFNDPVTIGDTLPEVTYEDVGDSPVLQCYMIVDIYQNYAWTETVEFSY